MVIGLDCAEPTLVFERWRDRLPTLSGLMERGCWGRLTSVIPPITVPAWSCMMASRTPGDLGTRVVLHAGEPPAGRPRHLRLPHPRGPRLRRLLHPHRDRRQGPAHLGPRAPRGQAVDRPRRPRYVPAAPAERRHGHVLP